MTPIPVGEGDGSEGCPLPEDEGEKRRYRAAEAAFQAVVDEAESSRRHSAWVDRAWRELARMHLADSATKPTLGAWIAADPKPSLPRAE